MNKETEIEFLKLAVAADAAGRKAATDCTPVPMVVVQRANPLNDSSEVVQRWDVPDGVCGFGWVVVRPATSSFARWAKKNIPYASKDYYGGLHISSPLMTQSMTRNEAYCRAFAKVLSDAGIKAYSNSRID